MCFLKVFEIVCWTKNIAVGARQALTHEDLRAISALRADVLAYV